MDFDTTVKLKIYETVASTAKVPASRDLARMLDTPVAAVEASFARLRQKRLLVPEPYDPGRIRMAPPFSGVETSFRVTIDDRDYYANCVWDALGVAAALHRDGVVDAEDAHTGEAMTITIREGRPVPCPCVIHFAVPAARWWNDIIYT